MCVCRVLLLVLFFSTFSPAPPFYWCRSTAWCKHWINMGNIGYHPHRIGEGSQPREVNVHIERVPEWHEVRLGNDYQAK